MALGVQGPPKLPPLPTRGAPGGDEAQPETSEPKPDTPPPKGGTATQVEPVAPRPTPKSPPANGGRPGTAAPGGPNTEVGAPPPPPTTTASASGPTASPGRPEIVEPPQPSATVGPAPEPPPDDASPSNDNDGKKTTRADSSRGRDLAPPIGAGLLPGDEPARPVFRLPPPRRPPYSGVGLFVGAGISFSTALAEQIVAHIMIKRRCIEPFANDVAADDPDEEAENFRDALVGCAPGLLPAVALRVHSDIGLLAMIGLASTGAALRAQRDAYDEVFADRPPRALLGLRAGGASLVGFGVVTWLTTGAVSWGLLARCRTARCATRARLVGFTTRDTGAVMIAAGSGMLAYAISHRRGYDRYFRERAMSLGATFLPNGGALTLRGRF